MQQAVQIRKPCQRAHQRGQEEVISVCLNENCPIRLACVNCSRDGYHKDHPADLSHFDYLQADLEQEIVSYHNAGILTLINQKRQQFNHAKADVIKTLDLLEDDFLQVIERATKADQVLRESIKMVETKDFMLFRENHAQVLVDLKGNQIIERLKRLVAGPIIQELQSLNQFLKRQLQSSKMNEFLKKHCQDALQLEVFEKNRLNYDSELAKEMKLVLEDRISELNESNSFYLGGCFGNLKHGRGILVNRDSQQILEGLWEKNSLKWGTQFGTNSQKLTFIYIGSFQNDKREGNGNMKWSNGNSYEGGWRNDLCEGKGIFKWSNGDSYEGGWRNDLREGKGIYQYSNGDSEKGLYKDGLPIGEHKVYKPTSQRLFKINIYGDNGKVKETKMLE